MIQGTAGVAIAGLLGAVRAQGKPMIDFPKQKIVVAGAGRFDTSSALKLSLFCIRILYMAIEYYHDNCSSLTEIRLNVFVINKSFNNYVML